MVMDDAAPHLEILQRFARHGFTVSTRSGLPFEIIALNRGYVGEGPQNVAAMTAFSVFNPRSGRKGLT